MEPGTHVELHGLVARSELNGRRGTVLGLQSTGRLGVEVDGAGRTERLSIKSENLSKVEEPADAEDTGGTTPDQPTAVCACKPCPVPGFMLAAGDVTCWECHLKRLVGTTIIPFETSDWAQAVHRAVQAGSTRDVQGLLGMGAQETIGQPAPYFCGVNALFTAAMSGQTACLRAILQAGQAVDMQRASRRQGGMIELGGGLGTSPLMIACQYGHSECVHALIAASANVDLAHEDDNGTPLYSASQTGELACVELLLEAGAAVDPPDHKGSTPLMVASMTGYPQVVGALIAASAELDAVNDNECTPMSLACQDHEAKSDAAAVECITLLLEAGASPDLLGNGLPLINVACSGNLPAVKLLCESMVPALRSRTRSTG